MADHVQKVGRRPAARRWGSACAVVLGTGLAVTLAACATPASSSFTPKPIETITPSAPPTVSATPSEAPTSASATPTATQAKAVKATGTLAIYMTVTKKLAGTCRTVSGAPTITLADHDNEWYGTVDLTVVLDSSRSSVASIDGAFGEDSEGFTWKLGYSASDAAKGTSAALTTSGSSFTVSGKLTAKETRDGKTTTELLPYKITAKCAAGAW
ncbi:MAG: lipoprotein LpqH [Propionicimonas sp.]|uniref:lipoprotein LpqH n=1 Tax=Propionicimonas sp. TaxID=1955623 RepID=UPI003D0F33D6